MELSKNSSYGKSVVEQLSRDLRLKYPKAKGYSVKNLWNMKRFYETYQKAKLFESPELQNNSGIYNQKLQPAAGESNGEKLQTLPAESRKLQTVSGESGKLQPVAAELLFQISWTNHALILDKTSSDEEKQKVYI